ncbi:hypothetical protein CAPN006_17500 [Capnocytophaga canimorsus]|nr:hypothetical protein CAPN006_17500 [Capnocytophaga canimorsus]
MKYKHLTLGQRYEIKAYLKCNKSQKFIAKQLDVSGVMTGDDFSLDINNPKEPKILCVSNNPDRQNIYSADLGLYNS